MSTNEEALVHTGQAIGWYRCDGKDCPICGTALARHPEPALPVPSETDLLGKIAARIACKLWDVREELKKEFATIRAEHSAALHEPFFQRGREAGHQDRDREHAADKETT